MAGEEVVKAGCLLLETLRSGRVGIVRDERGEVVDLLVEGRGLLGRVGSVEEASRFFVEWMEPPPLFVVVGSGQVARVLEALARTAGFPTAWVAPDADGAERELGILERLAPGAFVFVASEGGRPYDEEALYLALRAGARYVGLLASRQRAALFIASMLRRGVPLDEIRKRLRSPMGLDIGAKTAGEIAVSALAEAVMELRGGTGRPLSEVKNPYALLQEALSGNISHRCPPKTEAGDLHTPISEGNR